jgi:hypothetical protein
MLLPALKLGYRPRRDRRGCRPSASPDSFQTNRYGGWRMDLETRGALDGLLSDTSLLQARVDAGWTIPQRQHDQWLLRGSLGASVADDFDKMPISLRYFAGGDMLAGQIGSAFGLEEAAIESDAGTRELSLVLGRYLTPRLYLRYVQGLEEGLQTFLLRYELTRHFHVQAQSGVKAGVDVFYSFER